ncbi:hypothetical protein [Clostridium beijerinckii]|uniref:hypothetical protein n=1 Tax=Clostridium beijerinckii TaxID=1520 RepID=UPI00156FF66A|nr:hypothetical protein [Clostridium beijerinckii]NRT72683.1 hypothetical protein [Clostridium beijerinckii]
MKKLNFNNETFEADKIIRFNNNIIGQDANRNELFAFKGISDFTGFAIINEDGTDAGYDYTEPSISDLQAQIFNLTTQLVRGGII